MEQHTADFSTFYKIENQLQKLIVSKQRSIRDFLQGVQCCAARDNQNDFCV